VTSPTPGVLPYCATLRRSYRSDRPRRRRAAFSGTSPSGGAPVRRCRRRGARRYRADAWRGAATCTAGVCSRRSSQRAPRPFAPGSSPMAMT